MFRKPETEVFSTLQELGISLTRLQPDQPRLLAGSLTEYADMNTNDIRGAWPRFTREALPRNSRIVEVLNEFGKTRGMTSAQISLADVVQASVHRPSVRNDQAGARKKICGRPTSR